MFDPTDPRNILFGRDRSFIVFISSKMAGGVLAAERRSMSSSGSVLLLVSEVKMAFDSKGEEFDFLVTLMEQAEEELSRVEPPSGTTPENSRDSAELPTAPR